MDEQIKRNLSAASIWIRLLYMLFFAAVLYISIGVFALAVLLQFIITLITGTTNSKLLSFSDVLGRYIFQCIRFESFVSDNKPFPFDDFPEAELQSANAVTTNAESTEDEPSTEKQN